MRPLLVMGPLMEAAVHRAGRVPEAVNEPARGRAVVQRVAQRPDEEDALVRPGFVLARDLREFAGAGSSGCRSTRARPPGAPPTPSRTRSFPPEHHHALIAVIRGVDRHAPVPFGELNAVHPLGNSGRQPGSHDHHSALDRGAGRAARVGHSRRRRRRPPQR